MKKKKRRKPSPPHPWDRWFSHKTFRLVRYKHYHCQPHSMAAQVRNAAGNRKLLVSVLMDEGLITVTITKCTKRGSKI